MIHFSQEKALATILWGCDWNFTFHYNSPRNQLVEREFGNRDT